MESTISKTDYERLLADIKRQISSAQTRAVFAVNRELVLLYWQIGRQIAGRQQIEGWGAKVIERLAADLNRAFPEVEPSQHARSGQRMARTFNCATACRQIAVGTQYTNSSRPSRA